MQERKVIGTAPNEFVSEYSVLNIVNQYQRLLLLSIRDYPDFSARYHMGTVCLAFDDHAQQYELSVMAKTKKMVQVLLDFIANWREFYDHSYFRDLTSNQRRLEKWINLDF